MKTRGWIAFLSFVVAYIASRIGFAAAGFAYNVFSDPFDLGKLVVDFGVWIVLYALSHAVLVRVFGAESSPGKGA
ncbi:MAG: hypothetical protein IH621_01005 [Krumholzibacteria bacterium]|nr:hypothetical protein [Candidatus Krumholzibacteria bacterium]